MRKLLYSRFVKRLALLFFSFFYDKQYLKGYYFDTKRMGWYWAWRGLKTRKRNGVRIPYPVNPQTIVSSDRVVFDPNDLHMFQVPGCYWQVHDGHIYVGRNTHVAPNVGLITTNHDIQNPNRHVRGEDIRIGNYCWIGMNAVILPGVTLGDHTVVAAGAVVTKSFPEGYVVLGGVPAKVIKTVDKGDVSTS